MSFFVSSVQSICVLQAHIMYMENKVYTIQRLYFSNYIFTGEVRYIYCYPYRKVNVYSSVLQFHQVVKIISISSFTKPSPTFVSMEIPLS